MSVFDIEGDGLYPTKIHVLSYKDEDKIASLTNYDEMKKWLLSQEVLVGHNIIRFDIPHLERLLEIEIKAKLIDTLALSWYLYGEVKDRHGLAEWGEEFGVAKPEVEDWVDQPIEVYIHRCEEDVKINSLLWEKQKKYLSKLYETKDPTTLPIISYLSFKLDCAREQEASGWKVDLEVTRANLEKLEKVREEKELAVRHLMPLVPEYVSYHYPLKPFKKNGDLSEHGLNWKARCESLGLTFDHKEDIKIVKGYKEANPSSPQQVKEWLFSLGWKPSTFKYVKEEDGSSRAIPQVKKQFEPEFCDSVKVLFEKEPALEVLEGLSVVNHRIGLLKGFLDKEEDGWVKAEINGFTNTLRFKHIKPCVNLPGLTSLYGKEVRECLIAEEGYILCGSDQSALEDLTKRHYMMPYDPDYVNEMSKPGYDPHLDLALYAGKVTEEDIEFFKWASKEGDLGDNAKGQLKPLKKIRQDYKKTNYSATYGVGKDKLARDLGSSTSEAKGLLGDFWSRNWAIKAVAEAQKVRKVEGQMWLYNPVSKFYYSLRNEKDRFSTLNQSTGVFAFDSWIKEFRKERPQLTAQFHDEVILHIKQGAEDKCTKLLLAAQDRMNEKLNLNVTLSISIAYGRSYAEIH